MTAHNAPDAAKRFPVSWTARERLLEAQRRERDAVREFSAACRRANTEIAKRDTALAALQTRIDKANECVDAAVATLVEVSGIARASALTALDESRVREVVRAQRGRRPATAPKGKLESAIGSGAALNGPVKAANEPESPSRDN